MHQFAIEMYWTPDLFSFSYYQLIFVEIFTRLQKYLFLCGSHFCTTFFSAVHIHLKSPRVQSVAIECLCTYAICLFLQAIQEGYWFMFTVRIIANFSPNYSPFRGRAFIILIFHKFWSYWVTKISSRRVRVLA
jgi:hypothetical protein